MTLSAIVSTLTGATSSSGSTSVLHSLASTRTEKASSQAATTDTYSSSASDLLSLASNATYTNLALLTAAQKGTDYDPHAGESAYLNAKLDSFQIYDQMEAAKQSQIVTTMAQFGGITTGVVYDPDQSSGGAAAAAADAAAIKRAYQNESDKRVVKDAAESFKKDRAEADQQAEDAQAPKDAEGNPIVVDGNATDASSPRPKDAAGNPVASDQNAVDGMIAAAGQGDGQTAPAGQADASDTTSGAAGQGTAAAPGEIPPGAQPAEMPSANASDGATLASAAGGSETAAAAAQYAATMAATNTGSASSAGADRASSPVDRMV